MRIVVALGGNAIGGGEHPAEERRTRLLHAAAQLADLCEEGHEVVVTHGNGPQVGELLLDQESRAAPERGEPLPLDVLVAMTQAELGYGLQSALTGELARRGQVREVVTLVTQVEVDADDPAFVHPSKPVGPRYAARPDDGRAYARTDDGRWRRVVASPLPRRVVERDALRAVVEAGIIPVCGGGGGVPVVREHGRLRGVEAVLDKDTTSALIADDLAADALLILTDVGHVERHHGTRSARPLDELTTDEARTMLGSADAPSGTMGPKLAAAVHAAEAGRLAIIAELGRAREAVAGRTGTRVTATTVVADVGDDGAAP